MYKTAVYTLVNCGITHRIQPTKSAVKSYDLNPHLYAEDTQIYGFSQPATETYGSQARLQTNFRAV